LVNKITFAKNLNDWLVGIGTEIIYQLFISNI